MTSKELALKLVAPFLNRCAFKPGIYVTAEELFQLKDNIELFLLRKFEEGRHVGRDHDEKK